MKMLIDKKNVFKFVAAWWKGGLMAFESCNLHELQAIKV
jgi:hypothetical protein